MRVSDGAIKQFRYIGLLSGIATAAFCVSVFFFCPRFVLWRGLVLPELSPALRNPEVNRAKDVLLQLEHPFVKVTNPSNIAIQWRVFFPLIGHALHLPIALYMAIPHLGCIIVLGYIAHLILRETGRLKWAFFGATLTATGSWFFVSTGWLTYADSWYLLGVLIVCFSNWRWAIAAACLFEPFIDERFVLSLPLALAIRYVVFTLMHPVPVKQFFTDAGIVAGLTVPYVAVRLAFLHGSDSNSSNYIHDRIGELAQGTPWWRYALGVWMGLRGGWALVAAAVAWLYWEKRKLAGWILLAAVLLSIAIGLVIAADVGRSSSALWPAAVLGFFLLARNRPQWVRYGLPSLVAANLVLPASNVITLFTEPVYYLYAETARWADPPPEVDPLVYAHDGQALLGQNHLPEAKQFFDWALLLDPQCVPALVGRAVAYMNLQDLDHAIADADEARSLDPTLADAMFVRGVLAAKKGQTADAVQLLQAALKASAPDWPQRERCQQFVTQLQPAVAPTAPNQTGGGFHL